MDYSKTLAQLFNIKEEYAQNIINLLDDGNTIPFIARYRKEMHGSMDDQLITVYLPLSLNAIMRTDFPIIFAAIPTQVSRYAINVSSKSFAIIPSAFDAGFDFIPRNIGSCINSLTIISIHTLLTRVLFYLSVWSVLNNIINNKWILFARHLNR